MSYLMRNLDYIPISTYIYDTNHIYCTFLINIGQKTLNIIFYNTIVRQPFFTINNFIYEDCNNWERHGWLQILRKASC